MVLRAPEAYSFCASMMMSVESVGVAVEGGTPMRSRKDLGAILGGLQCGTGDGYVVTEIEIEITGCVGKGSWISVHEQDAVMYLNKGKEVMTTDCGGPGPLNAGFAGQKS